VNDELVIDLTKCHRPGWPCPNCGGKGRVKLVAFTDEEMP